MADRMIDKQNKGADLRSLGDGFDVVLVPHGSVDQEMVVGRIGAADVSTVSPSRVRSAKRFWRRIKHNAISMKFRPALIVPVAVANREPEGLGRAETPHYEDAIDQKAHQLLGELAQTIEQLGNTRSAFRAELLAAIEEGDLLLKKVAR